MRISDWSSDVCSSDLNLNDSALDAILLDAENILFFTRRNQRRLGHDQRLVVGELQPHPREHAWTQRAIGIGHIGPQKNRTPADVDQRTDRSEEHTSELQSLMRISYAVFCL